MKKADVKNVSLDFMVHIRVLCLFSDFHANPDIAD